MDLLGRVQKGEDPLGGGHRRLVKVELVGKVAEWLEEVPGVVEEGDEKPQADGPLQHALTSPVKHRGRRQLAEEGDQGEERGKPTDDLDVGGKERAVFGVELGKLAGFPGKELHGDHPGEVFG